MPIYQVKCSVLADITFVIEADSEDATADQVATDGEEVSKFVHACEAMSVGVASTPDDQMPSRNDKPVGVTYVCGQCGGRNICCDAWAEWSDEEQRWELAHTFSQTVCNDCEGETTAEERSLPTG